MRRIVVENGHSDGSLTVGEFQSDFRPTLILGFLIFHFVRFLCDFEKLISRLATFDGPLFVKNGHSEGAPTVGDSSPIPDRL